MNISKQVIILSAELTDNSHQENEKRTTILRNCLSDIGVVFNEAIGVYKGREESSFVVLPQNEDEMISVKDFAFKNFDQESVLVQDSNQEAYLVFQDGTETRLGRLQQVTPEVAQAQDGYTILNGNYYTALPRI